MSNFRIFSIIYGKSLIINNNKAIDHVKYMQKNGCVHVQARVNGKIFGSPEKNHMIYEAIPLL